MDLSKLLKVIDVSRWQGIINWGMVRGNVDAAMIKIGGSDKGMYMDGQAQRNLIEARSAGVPIGMYYYLGGVHTIAEEVQHIVNLFNQLGGMKPGEPFALDWEERRAGHDEVGYLTGIVEGLSKRGFPPPMIYMNLHYVKSQNWQNLVTRNCGLWVAAWGNNDAVPDQSEIPGSDEWPFWAMWQFSSTGTTPGISGRVDQNRFNGTLETFKKYGLKDGLVIPGSPTPVPVAKPSPESVTEYTVVPGDSLSRIAGLYGRSWQELYALNRDRIANPDHIMPGQRLRLWGTPVNAPVATVAQQTTQRIHTVASGENLTTIGRNYGLSWQNIYNANRGVIGSDPNFIKPGQRLVIL
jgi:GH25 family lysozyme M1 (1,4-beta-N-acetylmuramidase)